MVQVYKASDVTKLTQYTRLKKKSSWLSIDWKPNNRISEFCCNSKYATSNLLIAFSHCDFETFFSTENF